MREVLCRDSNNVQLENKTQKMYKYFFFTLIVVTKHLFFKV